MTMTRKEFVDVAEVIADAKTWIDARPEMTATEIWLKMGRRLEDVCSTHRGSGGFDRSRFRNAAKLPD